MNWICKLFGHQWEWYLCNGDDGEPAENRCRRCRLQTVFLSHCRCLPNPNRSTCCNCVGGLLQAVASGRVLHNPGVFHCSDWAPYLQQIETLVRAVQTKPAGNDLNFK